MGSQALRKIKPMTFDEICACNSLMRLTTDGEQPLDKFLRFKKDGKEWEEELDENGLNKDEKRVIYEHLNKRHGLCDTQESLMMLAMDERIGNFDLIEANILRKAVMKHDVKKIQELYDLFIKKGTNKGNRVELLNYVWDFLFRPQFSYAFSLPHIAAYSLILMIELNACYNYGSIFWKTACLSINSGIYGDDGSSGNDYSSIAKAIGGMKDIVQNPDINKSDLGFIPFEEKNKILFGLKPIIGLGIDTAKEIIKNRPYHSFDHFFETMIKTKKISGKKAITLIKAGCFDNFCENRKELMVKFIHMYVDKKSKLTMSNFSTVRHLIDKDDKELNKMCELFDFRSKITGRNKIPMNKEIEQEFIEKYAEKIGYTFNDGQLEIDVKEFDKYYNKKITPIKEWLKRDEIVEEFNLIARRKFWKEECLGSVESWEIQTVLFYSKDHELDHIPVEKMFDIKNFFEEPEEPAITGYKFYKENKYPQYSPICIAGTVVDKDKNKSIISVLTQHGLVSVRIYKKKFAHYDEKIMDKSKSTPKVIDASWFERGTKLVFVGYRRGNDFVLNNKNTNYQKNMYKIISKGHGDIMIQDEKINIE